MNRLVNVLSKKKMGALLLIVVYMVACGTTLSASEPILTVEEAQGFPGLEDTTNLSSSGCGDLCLIFARDGGTTIGLFDASNTNLPLFTLAQAQGFSGLEYVDRLGTTTCGGSCLIQVQDGNLTIGLFDVSDTSVPLLTLAQAQGFYGLGSADRLNLRSCGDTCLIGANQGFSVTLGVFDTSDTSSPILTLTQAQSFYGLGGADRLFLSSSCGDLCLIEARQGNNPIIGLFDASDTSAPLLTALEAASFYGLESVTRLQQGTCGDLCLIRAQNSSGDTLGLFDAAETSSPFFTVIDAQAFYGLENVERLQIDTCGDLCLIETQNSSGDTLAIFDASYTSGPLFTLAEAQSFYGLENVDRLEVDECGNSCLVAAFEGPIESGIFDLADTSEPLFTVQQAQNFYGLESIDRVVPNPCGGLCLIRAQDVGDTLGVFDASNTSAPLITVQQAQDFYGLENVDKLFLATCGDRCLILAQDAVSNNLALFDASDVSQPLFTVSEAQAFYGLENVDRLSPRTCGDRCLILALNSSFATLGVFDASDTSDPLLTVTDVQAIPGLGSVERLEASSCGELCLIDGRNSSFDILIVFDASDTSIPFFTLAEAQSFPGLEYVESLTLSGEDACEETCLIGARDSNNTVVIFGLGGYSVDPCDPFPVLEVSGLENLVACRNAEFCYELTISNPVNMYQNEDSGNITVTGLLDTDWTVTEVIDCSNGEASYTGPVGTVWTNLLDQNITFDEAGTGTWMVGVLQPDASICIKLCGTDPDVGNKVLNIEVTQTP